MDVVFTGAKTTNEICFNTIIDGELIAHNKKGSFINLYAAFDIYYYRKEDVRSYTFMLLDKEENMYKSRYYLLKSVISELKPVSIIENKEKEQQTFTKLLENYRLRTFLGFYDSSIDCFCTEFSLLAGLSLNYPIEGLHLTSYNSESLKSLLIILKPE
jgi:hypothetical protein